MAHSPTENHRISSGQGKLQLAVWRQRAPRPNGRPPVLYVHGATFGATLAFGHRFDGHSWADNLNDAGFDAWGFDFLGYDQSDRYPEMALPAAAHAPLGRAPAAAPQIGAVVDFIVTQTGISQINLLAHSWGNIAASRYAIKSPQRVARLAMFAPILRGVQTPAVELPAWQLVTIEAQWTRFKEDVPAGHAPVLSRAHFDPWAQAYLESDPASRDREPPAVQVPCGPAADIGAAARGELPYDPRQLQAPLLVVRGAWDHLCTDADVARLFAALAPATPHRDAVIPAATHLMHLEQNRFSLYQATREFFS
ncbi:MAG TPA: alpha/beta fold hydrolase [Burkholderiales bacterium]